MASSTNIGESLYLMNVGKRTIMRRELFVGKYSGQDFGNHLPSCMNHLDFKPCLADPSVRPVIKSDVNEHYESVLLYTDDVLIVSDNYVSILRNKTGKCFELKEDPVRPPKMHLSSSMKKVELENGVCAWVFIPKQCVKEAVQKVEDCLQKLYQKLRRRAEITLRTKHRPELES